MYTSKDQVRCVIVTGGWRIEGDMHILSGSRMTDSLNSKAKDFIAVTNAVVFEADSGRELYRTPYAAVNRDTISVVFPIEDVAE